MGASSCLPAACQTLKVGKCFRFATHLATDRLLGDVSDTLAKNSHPAEHGIWLSEICSKRERQSHRREIISFQRHRFRFSYVRPEYSIAHSSLSSQCIGARPRCSNPPDHGLPPTLSPDVWDALWLSWSSCESFNGHFQAFFMSPMFSSFDFDASP